MHEQQNRIVDRKDPYVKPEPPHSDSDKEQDRPILTEKGTKYEPQAASESISVGSDSGHHAKDIPHLKNETQYAQVFFRSL